ncbi:MAG: hypothetical protein PVF13_07455 [Chromatiales bacterium]|jgi:HEAT repeat protein
MSRSTLDALLLPATGPQSLAAPADSKHANIRADAAQYLGADPTRSAEPHIRKLLADKHPDVREIAD